MGVASQVLRATGPFTLVERLEVSAAEWDAFVGSADEAWLWHTHAFLDIIATWPQFEDASFALRAPSGELAAVVPLRIERSLIRHVVPWTTLSSQGGPVLDGRLDADAREIALGSIAATIHALARRTGAVQVHVSRSALAPANNSTRADPVEAWPGSRTPAGSRVIELSSPEERIWEGLEKRARNGVTRAEREGVVVRASEDAADVVAYYRLHEETYGRTGVRAHPRAYFERMTREIHARGRGRMFLAEMGGEVVAAANVGLYKGGAVYWTGASNARGLDTNANTLLQWRILQAVRAGGARAYEIGEIPPPDADEKFRSLDKFKRSFGGAEVATLRKTWVVRPGLLRALQLGRFLVRSGVRDG